MICVEETLRDLMDRARVDPMEPISDEQARALFREWKHETMLSVGDLFRAIESKGRNAAREEGEAMPRTSGNSRN